MKRPTLLSSPSLPRISLTLIALSLALLCAVLLWHHDVDAPWTRDARIRADVIQLAPDVGGLVTAVEVRDNQSVAHGQAVFRIDTARYDNAERRAAADLDMARSAAGVASAEVQVRKAEAASARTALDMRNEQARRRRQAGPGAASREEIDDAQAAAAMAADAWRLAQSRLAQAQADASRASAGVELARTALQEARLDQQRSVVKAPVDGFVTNLLLRPGDYVHPGQPVLALVDRRSFYVNAYFEENKLGAIHPGDRASVHMVAGGRCLAGTVQAIARGIAERDNPTGHDLLLDTNPVFDWVRLAQRIPVRIQLDALPADVQLSAGMSATVTVLPHDSARPPC